MSQEGRALAPARGSAAYDRENSGTCWGWGRANVRNRWNGEGPRCDHVIAALADTTAAEACRVEPETTVGAVSLAATR